MRAALTDCHTDRGALHPSGFHPHEKQSGKARGLQTTQPILFLPYSNGSRQCHHPALREKEALCLIRVSPSNPHTITGYAAAVIKASFQHSTQHDLFQCKHSLSRLNPESLRWDVNRRFYVGEKEKKYALEKMGASSGKQGLKGFNHHLKIRQQLRQQTLEETEYP